MIWVRILLLLSLSFLISGNSELIQLIVQNIKNDLLLLLSLSFLISGNSELIQLIVQNIKNDLGNCSPYLS